MIDKTRISASALLLPMVSMSALLAGCGDGDPTMPPQPQPVERGFTFDQDMEGWHPVAIDTLHPPIEWHVRQSSEQARSGTGSVELFLANYNDAGKIWMERGFDLEPGVTYEVEVTYAFGTADWGDVNLFTIIAGVHGEPPRRAEDLTFQGNTGHGQGQDAGYVWVDKEYSFTRTAPSHGTLHVALGVWGTWETPRTYFVDDLTVRFTPADR